MNKPLMVLTLAISTVLFGSASRAADILAIPLDPAGQGYNDPTPVAPVPGNPGTTLGAQRLIVAQFAADLWGSVLQSNVPVFVGARFSHLGANVLGSAGATTVFTNFAPGIVSDTWYSSALADSLAGTDLRPNFTDVNSNFSSDFNFYYGLDGNTPAGKVSFLDVVMHEYGHGLGFQNFENEADGSFLDNTQDIYSVFTFDNDDRQVLDPDDEATAQNVGAELRQGRLRWIQCHRRRSVDPRPAHNVPGDRPLVDRR